ncbi:hypothetical protein BJX70DRAFT_371584 [Aspergillus crustosus]
MNNSWRSPSNTGGDPSSSPYTASNGWPTPRSQPSPGRREHATQPPPLNTTFNNPQFQGLGVGLGPGYVSTPLSTTSLSSPFIHSPAVNSPAGATGPSPMASRQYSAPYNPQEWGPVSNGPMAASQSAYSQPSNMLRIVPQPRYAGPRSELSPPPPPYSPPSQQQQADHTNHNTPILDSSSPNHPSPYIGTSRQHSIPQTRPLSTVRTDAGHSRQVSLPPPPPLPQGAPSSRSSSHNRTEVYHDQSSYNAGSRPFIMVSEDNLQSSQPSTYSYSSSIAQREDLSRPPTSRRAVSAGPVVGSASTSRATSQSRNQSPQNPAWEPGMPLPPPPPGPPPVPRSHSVNGLGDTSSYRNSQPLTRTRQPPSLGTGLGSIPPTPAGWVDEIPIEPLQKRDRAPL